MDFGKRGLVLLAIGFAFLIWLPLALAGLPLDTPDGFMHLGWSVGWVRQLQAGWLWPTWNELPWAGAGSYSFLIYPPLFRVLSGLPMLLGWPVDQAVSWALLLIFLINSMGAAALASIWLPPGRWRLLLLVAASLNPYLWINVYVRGAWPEALAQALLWWVVLGILGMERRRQWGVVISSIALAGVLLSNWNSALLVAIAWILGGVLMVFRCRKIIGSWLFASFFVLALTSAFWVPALLSLNGVRSPMPPYLFKTEFFFGGDGGPRTFADLLWVQSICIIALMTLRWCGWGWSGLAPRSYSGVLPSWGLLMALLGLAMMFPPANSVYEILTPLQRIQFPWRWLGVTWAGCIVWLTGAGLDSRGQFLARGSGARLWAMRIASAASILLWTDGLSRFAANWTGHAPSSLEKVALRKLFECDPLSPCPDGVDHLPARGELQKRFARLSDGRIALKGVPDYSSGGNPDCSWDKEKVLFWAPNWPQSSWMAFAGPGRVDILQKQPTRRLFYVQAQGNGHLRIMQWAHPNWRVQVRSADQFGRGIGSWDKPLERGAGDPQGWISVPLPKGNWQVRLDYSLQFSEAPRSWGWCSSF